MKNFTKAFLISSLMSGSFMVNAMDDSWRSSNDKEVASLYGITTPHEFYAQQKAMGSFIVDVDSFSFEDLREQQKALASFKTSPTPGKKRNPIDDDAEMAASFGMSLPEYLEQKGAMDSFALINDLELQKEEGAVLAHRPNDEELPRQLGAQAVISLAPFIPYEASLKEQITYKTWEYANGENRPALEKFMGIFQHLKTIPQGSDVHILDNYVFGSQKKVNDLLEVGRLYNVDDGNLTLAQVGQQMVQFANNHKDFFATYQYEGHALNSDKIIPILNAHFPNMDNEIRAISPEARELWSRAWTLALNLCKEGDKTAIQIIFDQAVEGHLTRGGCIQGRIDRGFVGYANLLARAGVTL